MVPNICTVVSVVPYDIRETRPGLMPGIFYIPAAPDDGFNYLHVGRSIEWIYLDVDRGSKKTEKQPEEIAKSIVEDFSRAQVESRYDDNIGPGVFWKPQGYTELEIQTLLSKDLDAARASQKLWFAELVKIGDDYWERFHQHQFISNMHRLAAKYLQLERPWITRLADNPQFCPACKTQLPKGAIICAQCKCIIDKVAYAQFQFA